MELIHDMFRTILFLGVFAKYNTQNATTNDLIIEKINNCQCVLYYLCNNNSYIITDGEGFIEVRFNKEDKIPCSAFNKTCCKLKSDKEDLEPTERRPTNYLSCGQPRTSSLTNTLTPNDKSVAAINGEIPWIVSIFQVLSSGENNYKFKCAGSIIHPKVILTATHCVRSSKASGLKVVATGKEMFQDLNTASDNEIRDVVKLIKHENYYSGGLHNDIALLLIDKQFDFTKAYVNSVCLPKIEDNFEGQRCIAMGWGQTNNVPNRSLKKVDVPIIEHQHCEGQLRSTRLGNNFSLDSSFLCAGGEKGKDTCCGDGGGPLVCLKGNSSYVIVGIVSWGIDCGVENVPGVYTNVTHFTDWINTQFNNNRDSIDNNS